MEDKKIIIGMILAFFIGVLGVVVLAEDENAFQRKITCDNGYEAVNKRIRTEVGPDGVIFVRHWGGENEEATTTESTGSMSCVVKKVEAPKKPG